MLRTFLGENTIGKRNFLVLTILFLSVFGWFFMTLPVIEQMLGPDPEYQVNLAVWAAFYLSIIGSSILGSLFSQKIGKLKFIYLWAILGVAVSFLPAIINTASFEQVFGVSLFLGVSFGWGVPAFFAYFVESTVVENRGRVAAITFLLANLAAPFLSIVASEFDFMIVTVLFALLRGTSLFIFFLKPEEQLSSDVPKDVSFREILKNRTFLLYFVAWSMFPLIDNFERVLVIPFLSINYPNLVSEMGIVEPLVAGLSILIAGILCDRIGRKKIVLSGFVAIGIAYGLIGILHNIEFLWYVYFIVDAIAWGIFSLIFFIILWGDIAHTKNSQKFYAIGSIPFFVGSILPYLLPSSIVENIEIYATFSVASLFLFVAVMPLVFAPETLPEKKIELRRLKNFAEEAKKAREKFEQKKK
ncbi:MAG: MFS transporter [Candidatus Bathyarchaeota archaeon]|nr:MAG: MFS transporter [Candidatus Bathyarchaeum tardum]WNZ29264.1 MAG: MFS transporter [Candidatus Bathyarchaeota archaeon]